MSNESITTPSLQAMSAPMLLGPQSAAGVGAAGPTWDLHDEYPAVPSAEITADVTAATALLDDMAAYATAVLDLDASSAAVAAAQELFLLGQQASRLLGNISVYCNCRLSVNSLDSDALAQSGELQNHYKRFAEVYEPLSQFVNLADESVIAQYLDHPQVGASAFNVHHTRARRHELLSLNEENLVSGLSQDGIAAWGNLYTQLSGTISCEVLLGNETQSMGLAQASGLLGRSEPAVRQAAWHGINAAWSNHAEACAASINAIAGWRLEMARKRSRNQPVHFLDAPVHQNRITRGTLDCLMQVTEAARPFTQAAAKLQARAYGDSTIGPWDQRAPAPDIATSAPLPFADAIELIAGAYAQVDPSMGDFVHMMADKHWIEATQGDNKRPGAYCTRFPKSNNPRVYMTYSGSASDTITLAHELGHALHNWLMRDLPDSQRSYGMSLAETASTFGETLVRDALFERASNSAEKLQIAWEDLSAITGFMLNIPTRFEFEQNFYKARAQRPLRPDELNELMSQAWMHWYGDSLAEPDPLFWANKLHFHISGISFYNFPYLFGYLFSLGIYAKRESFGEEFYPRYAALLRDTGRMQAEQLALEYLNADLSSASFWEDTISSLQPRVKRFELLLDDLGL